MLSLDVSDRSLPYSGLTSEQVKLNRQQYGINILTPPQRDPWWKLYLEKFADPVIRILMIAAIIAIIVGIFEAEYAEGVGILIAIFLSTTLAFFNEYKASQEFEILNQVYDQVTVKVIRDHQFTKIPRQDVVVGDIIYLEQGEEVPADGEVLSEVSLSVDQAKITGESEPVKKARRTQFEPQNLEELTYPPCNLYRSTIIAEGNVFFQVKAVGDRTEIGKLAKAISQVESGELTPLNIQLEKLSQIISIVGLSISVLIFFALFIRDLITKELSLTWQQSYIVFLIIISIIVILTPIWLPILDDGLKIINPKLKPRATILIHGFNGWIVSLFIASLILLFGMILGHILGFIPQDNQSWIPDNVVRNLLNYFMVAVTIIVVSVPEGLAMSVTLSLAYSMRKMAASHNLVRRMHACETIGAATVICSDKTGTLTCNQMGVEEINFPCLNTQNNEQFESYKNLIAEAIAANSTADLEKKPQQPPHSLGNVTEGALLLWLDSQKIDYIAYRHQFKIKQQIIFSAKNKYMATLGKSSIIEGNILHVKGAPEIILHQCSHILTEQGINPLISSIDFIIELLQNYQTKGMRTLGFAYSSNVSNFQELDKEKLNNNLIWLGFVVIYDPLRQEASSAIKSCLDAGIEVKIVTGDSSKTAQEIARQVNLWRSEIDNHNPSAHLTGQQFNQLSNSEAKEVIKSLKILSRAAPLDKLRLVKLLQENGEVVAVTGDGTNDAAALKQAQVGLAMGSGTAIAKEASDIILLDDSFNSIVSAVIWGRSLYENIQRFLLFQLTINIVALGIALLGPFIGVSLPLTVTQMLWINLIMDTFSALALATEPPHLSVMKRSPRNPNDFIISPLMARQILLVGSGFLLFLVGFLVYLCQDGEISIYELSIFFAVFVLLQFWNLFNARCLGLAQSACSELSKNKAFIGIAAVIFIGQILIVQFGGKVFRTVPLSLRDWLLIIGGTSIVLWLGELSRFQVRLKMNH